MTPRLICIVSCTFFRKQSFAGVLKNCADCTENYLPESIINKVTSLQLTASLKKGLQLRYFPVNFNGFFRKIYIDCLWATLSQVSCLLYSDLKVKSCRVVEDSDSLSMYINVSQSVKHR